MNHHIIGTDLTVTPYGKVKDENYALAVLPWGATEPHNQHLPYLTDCILSQEIALDAAQRLHNETGHRVMVMPPVFAGAQNPGQRDLKFCIHYRYETQKAILTDIVASLHHQGLRKMVIVNGHGGNSFKPMVRDLAVDYPDFTIVTTDWYAIVPTKDYFDERIDDHAGEQETSVMMHYHPEWVNIANAGDGHSHPFALDSLNGKTAWAPRNWLRSTDDTGIGNPKKASAEKGARYAEAVVVRLTALFKEMVEHDDLY